MNDILPYNETEIKPEPRFINYESFHYPSVPQFQSQPVAATQDEVYHHQISFSTGSNAAGLSKKSVKNGVYLNRKIDKLLNGIIKKYQIEHQTYMNDE